MRETNLFTFIVSAYLIFEDGDGMTGGVDNAGGWDRLFIYHRGNYWSEAYQPQRYDYDAEMDIIYRIENIVSFLRDFAQSKYTQNSEFYIQIDLQINAVIESFELYIHQNNLKARVSQKMEREKKMEENQEEDILEYEEPSPDSLVSSKTYIMIDKNTGFYKIGRSANPLQRERTLQSEKPTIELLLISTNNVERQLHNEFSGKRVRGEWFRLSDEDLNNVVDIYKMQKPDCTN